MPGNDVASNTQAPSCSIATVEPNPAGETNTVGSRGGHSGCVARGSAVGRGTAAGRGGVSVVHGVSAGGNCGRARST
ncbi:hypothetical protein PAXINDRAFT_171059 [Paxillus involutus ATCC 200175]|uniref:Unplaced genomic scaffold PAXINscaffold_39, whole genome shotgun sequence n=1 Tax=Paxillus involutus ATCC 200175 TaxID=664439 RepID=A0A0C9TZ97_PAXIN|nr:hypothetical protein PAXINDRAFT_171059 [Paxillus involutus ATCC 200175]